MPWKDIAPAFLIAFSVAAALLATRYQEPLGPDEAYLWYGVLRMFEGEVPQRDFRAYEPGRYLWCGLFAIVFGRTLAAVRLGTHVFYGLCLGFALLTLRGVGLTWLDTSLAALMLAAWAHPMHKLYEPGMLFLGFSASAWLALSPSPLSAALAGCAVGLALVFGFNYFLYLGAGLLLLFATARLATIPLPLDLIRWAVLGGIVGMLPFAAFCAAPGFPSAFIERRIVSILARGSTNLPLPAPWPWRPAPQQLQGELRIRQLGYGVLFVLLPAAPAFTLIAVWLGRPVMSDRLVGVIAAATVGAASWHHAYSRADRPHIAQVMAPLLLMVALFVSSSLALAILVAGSIALNWTLHPRLIRWRAPRHFRRLEVGHLRIWASASLHQTVESAAALSRLHLAHGGALLAVPSLVALYPILGLRAPIYDIYSVFPASQAEQERMLASIGKADVRLAFVADEPLDGRDELRFSKTHPLVWQHLITNMERIEVPMADVHVFAGSVRPMAADNPESSEFDRTAIMYNNVLQ